MIDAHILWRIEQLEPKVEKHDKDLYMGNGLPSITTRLRMTEKATASNTEAIAEMARNSRKTQFMVMGIFLTAVATLVVDIVLKH